MCFLKQIEPLMGTALYLEYEDVISRSQIFKKCLLRLDERHRLFDDFLSVCRWIRVYYSWRPNRKDEGDNHLVEWLSQVEQILSLLTILKILRIQSYLFLVFQYLPLFNFWRQNDSFYDSPAQ